MLRGIRKASENWLGRTVMGVVMTVLAGSFAVWGINDIFRGFGRSTLATIGSAEIPVEQYRQTYQDRLQQISRDLGHPLPPDQAAAAGLNRQVLDEMIAQAGLDQRVKQMRLGIPDSEIARRITTDPNLQSINGQFDRVRFEQILRNMNMTEQRFVADRRQTALRRQIIDSVSGDVTPPKAWLDAINQFQNQQRGIQYIALGPAQAGDIPPPTADELGKYFDAHKIQFRAPEYRKISTVTVTPSELSKWMEISDDELKKAYEQKRSSFTTPERRHIKQLVFPNMADAQAAADRIKAGTSFAAIAAERGVKEEDIDLGTVAKSGIVDPAAANAAFALKEGEVSVPVQGQFGTVLLTVQKIEPEVTRSFGDVMPLLRNEIALDRAKPQVQDMHDKIEDERAGGASLEEAAAKLKVPVTTFDAVDRFGHDPTGKPVVNLPRGADVMNAAFSSDVGIDNDPIEADGGYVWYDVAGITPAHDRPLDEMKGDVEQHWRADEIASRLKGKAAELLDKLNGGAPFDSIAAADGVKIATSNDLKRGASSANFSARMTESVFHTAKDGYGSAVGNDPAQWIVFRVTDVKTPARDPGSDGAKRVEQTVQRQLSDDVMGQYMAWLEGNLGTSINAAALAQAMSGGSGNSAPDIN
jgi:peptidyl-prolyl cis-trans isomerase D